jgi:hypothetical protein
MSYSPITDQFDVRSQLTAGNGELKAPALTETISVHGPNAFTGNCGLADGASTRAQEVLDAYCTFAASDRVSRPSYSTTVTIWRATSLKRNGKPKAGQKPVRTLAPFRVKLEPFEPLHSSYWALSGGSEYLTVTDQGQAYTGEIIVEVGGGGTSILDASATLAGKTGTRYPTIAGVYLANLRILHGGTPLPDVACSDIGWSTTYDAYNSGDPLVSCAGGSLVTKDDTDPTYLVSVEVRRQGSGALVKLFGPFTITCLPAHPTDTTTTTTTASP